MLLHRRMIWTVIVLEILYLFARYQVMHLDWFRALGGIERELVRTGLRGVSFAAVCWLCIRVGGGIRWNWSMRLSLKSCGLIVLLGLVASWGSTDGNPLLLSVVFALTASLVALREELVYRYVLQNYLEAWLPEGEKVFGSVLGSSFLFTLMHLGVQPIASFFWIFASSMLIGWLYHQSGKNLGLVVGAHFLIDVYIALG